VKARKTKKNLEVATPKAEYALSNMKKTHLFVDPSSQHLAYVLAVMDGESVEITEAGLIWTKTTWNRGQRFDYMFKCLDFLINKYPNTPYTIRTEAFFSNPKMMSGSSCIPTINDYICMLSSRDTRIDFDMTPPPVWRSKLGIKPNKDPITNKRDYKTPTLNVVETYLGKLPETIQSNITLKPRATPSDLADALAICLAHFKSNGISSFSVNRTTFLPVNIIVELNKIANLLI
jgi:Holliday junction resolvasome RuvABC endonuclease subunit